MFGKTSFLIFAVLFLTSSCKPSLWGFSWDELTGKKPLSGDSIPITSIDLEAMDRSGHLSDLDKMGPGAAYCLARILENEDLDKALFLYQHEIKNGSPLWVRESLFRMLLLLDREGRTEDVVVWGWKFHLEFPDDKRNSTLFIRNLFLTGRYDDIEKVTERLDNPDAESMLYIACSRAIRKKGKASVVLEPAILNLPLNPGYRIVLPVLEKEKLINNLSETVSGYLSGRILMLDRQYGKALSFIEKAANDPRLSENYPVIFEDYRLVRSGMPGKAAGADKLALWAAALKNRESRYYAALGAVRLYRIEERYELAEPLARLALASSSEGYQRDESLWQLLRILLELDLVRFSTEANFAGITDAAYFDDIFEMATVKIVQDRRWEMLPPLWQQVSLHGSPDARKHVAWVTLLAVHYKFLTKEAVSVQNLEEVLINSDRFEVRGLLSAYLSRGTNSKAQINDWIGLRRKKAVEETGKNAELSEYFSSLMKFGLNPVIQEEILIRYRETPNSTIIQCARYLHKEGDYYGTIRVLSRIFFESNYIPDTGDIKMMYPLGYKDLVESAAGEFSVDPGFIFAVIRSESAFKADIQSHAGALGLMQLMPATADEQAGVLELENPDILDAETNIFMGTSHIRWLIEREWTTCPMDILIAYNAGGGNLRKWKKRYEGLPALLLAEALPPKETRDYIRKNLLAQVIYEYIYFHKSPESVIGTFFGLDKDTGE